jgi:hypothetical protein
LPPEASEWGDHQEDTMRKLLLVNLAVAALGAGALMTDRADATTLGAAAGLRSAVDGAAPIEEVAYWRYRHHRRHVFYPYAYRSYAFYPRRHHHRRYWRY